MIVSSVFIISFSPCQSLTFFASQTASQHLSPSTVLGGLETRKEQIVSVLVHPSTAIDLSPGWRTLSHVSFLSFFFFFKDRRVVVFSKYISEEDKMAPDV